MEKEIYDSIPKIYNVTHDNPITVQLRFVDIKRYLIDATFLQEFQFNVHENNAYDIILTDKNYKIKCVIFPTFNQYFETNLLKPNTLIEATIKWNDSRVILSKRFPLLYSLKILSLPPEEPKSTKIINYVVESDLLYLQYYDINTIEDIPLIGNRSCYVHMHSDVIPLGPQWSKKEWGKIIKSPHKLFSNPNEHYYSIEEICKDYYEKSNLEEKKKRKSDVLDDPFIIARIMSKSILTSFAKPSDQIPYPFCFSVRLGDVSGEINLTFWNSLCPKYYNSLKIGDLLLVKDFVVKESYFKSNIDNKDWFNNFWEGDLELSLNPGSRDIIVIKGSILEMPEFSMISPLNHEFAKGDEIINSLNDSPEKVSKTFNYIGKVIFVGNEEKNYINGKLYLSRWITFYDTTLNFDVMFLCIMTSTDNKFHFNDTLKLYNVRAHYVRYDEGETSATLLLYPTFSTQICKEKSEGFSNLNLYASLRSIPLKSFYQKFSQEEFHKKIDKIESFNEISESFRKIQLLQRKEVFIQGFISDIYISIGKGSLNSKESNKPVNSNNLLKAVINILVTDIDREKQMHLILPVVPQLFSFREIHLLKIENLKMRLFQYLVGPCTEVPEQMDKYIDSLKKRVNKFFYTMGVTIYRISSNEFDFVVNNLYLNHEENCII